MKKNDFKVSIITLCFNQLEKATKPFIESLYKFTNTKLFELIIINNNSTDGTKEYLENIANVHKNIKIINNPQNFGYSKGNNQGLEIATGKYLILLNNDVLLTENWLEKTIKHLENNDNIGILSCLTNFCGNKKQLIKNYKELTPKNYLSLYNKYLSKKEVIEYSDKVIFFACAIKREVFEKIGYLDENFGLAWYEDDDYSIRAILNGFKVGIAKNVFIYHNHSLTSSNLVNTGDKNELLETNRIYFSKKYPFLNDFLSYKNKYKKYKKLFISLLLIDIILFIMAFSIYIILIKDV